MSEPLRITDNGAYGCIGCLMVVASALVVVTAFLAAYWLLWLR